MCLASQVRKSGGLTPLDQAADDGDAGRANHQRHCPNTPGGAMEVFEVVLALLLVGAALAAIARRVGAPYPALVALAGAALALIPGLPTVVLDPELALALFVAPVLVDAAFDASPRDLKANWRTVASLALGAVALTIAVVAGGGRGSGWRSSVGGGAGG